MTEVASNNWNKRSITIKVAKKRMTRMKCGTSSPFFVMVWFPTPKTAVGESLWFHHYAQVIVFFSSRAPILDEIKKWHETKITNTSQKMYFSCLARGAMILVDFFLQQKIRGEIWWSFFSQTQLRWKGSTLPAATARAPDDKRWHLRSKELFKVCFKKTRVNICPDW